jgi:hypothetical protein
MVKFRLTEWEIRRAIRHYLRRDLGCPRVRSIQLERDNRTVTALVEVEGGYPLALDQGSASDVPPRNSDE